MRFASGGGHRNHTLDCICVKDWHLLTLIVKLVPRRALRHTPAKEAEGSVPSQLELDQNQSSKRVAPYPRGRGTHALLNGSKENNMASAVSVYPMHPARLTLNGNDNQKGYRSYLIRTGCVVLCLACHGVVSTRAPI